MNNELENHLRRAIAKLEETRKELKSLKQAQRIPIAIVGMSCRMPGGANTPDQFWQKLIAAKPLTADVPDSRWDKQLFYSPDRNAPGKMYTSKAGFIDDPDMFDASFFNISRREALMMDPQQRLLLEETWQAFEQAGIAVDHLKGSDTAVYFGCGSHDYANHLNSSISKDDISAYYGTGNSSSVMAGRVAYILGFHGPAITLDTSCSSSLVAVHLACEQLRSGQSAVAVAGGVNAILTPDVMINFCKANMLAEDGLSKTFAENANGYARGEGVGVLILKRLDDALRDQDQILACIIGDGVNHDGASSGLTTPNGEAQIQLLQQTLKQFAISPESIDYVEAHGTGTPLGDPIEINALNQVFARSHSAENPLYIGSVKTNIGHLEAGAGIAGMIKVILSLQAQQIPAHLNLQQLNSLIDPSKIPFQIPQQNMPWPMNEKPRRATVSSFGFSGTNAFVVLEESPAKIEKQKQSAAYYPLIITAKTKTALMARVAQLQAADLDAMLLADVAYTLDTGRVHFEHGLFFACKDSKDLQNKLEQASNFYHHIPKGKELLSCFNFAELHIDHAKLISKDLQHSNSRFAHTVETLTKQLPDNERALKFTVIYALFDLFDSCNALPDFVQGDDFIKAIYYAYSGVISVEDAFKGILQDEHYTELQFIDDLNTIEEDFLLLTVFGKNHHSLENKHQMEAYSLLNQTDSSWLSIIEALLTIERQCASVNWQGFFAAYHCNRIALPTYPFERKRYWYEPTRDNLNLPLSKVRSFLLRAQSSPLADFQFLATIDLEKQAFLLDHTIYQQTLMPAAGLLELMYASLQEAMQKDAVELRHFQLLSPLILKAGLLTELLISVQDDKIAIYQQEHSDKRKWHLVANALWRMNDGEAKLTIKPSASDWQTLDLPYEKLATEDIVYGPSFQSIRLLQRSAAFCQAEIDNTIGPEHAMLSMLDAAFQAVVAFVFSELDSFTDSIYLPHSCESLRVYSTAATACFARLLLKDKTTHHCTVDIEVYDNKQQLLFAVTNYRAQRVAKSFLQHRSKESRNKALYYALQWEAVDARLTSLNHSTLIDLRQGVDETQLLTHPEQVFSRIKSNIEATDSEQALVFLIERGWQIEQEPINPSQAFIGGLIKSLALEYTQRTIVCLDNDSDTAAANLNSNLIIRQGKTYQPKLQELSATRKSTNLDSLYLLLGGTSAICLALVERLLQENPQAKIILVARNQPAKSALLNKVQVITGDLNQSGFVDELINQIAEQANKGFTLIHAAGVLADKLFVDLNAEQIRDVVLTKIKPLIEINTLCKQKGLIINQVLCLSSIASTFGSQGQSHYAAANAFLEAYMSDLRVQGVKATAVALSPIKESRMAMHSLLLKRFPQIGISLEETVEALMCALKQEMPAVFSVINNAFITQLQSHPLYQSWFKGSEPIETPTKQLAQFITELEHKSHSERVMGIKGFLLQSLGQVLQLQAHEYDENSGFFDLGMDSIMAVELFDLIQKSVGDRVKLNNTMLFDLPNITVLTDYLVEALFPKVQQAAAPKQHALHRVDALSDQDLLNEIDKLLAKKELDSDSKP